MHLLANIEAFRFEADPERPSDARTWRSLIQAVEGAGLSHLYSVHGDWSDEGAHVSIGDLGEVVRAAAGAGGGIWEMRSSRDEQADATCRVTVHPSMVSLLLYFRGEVAADDAGHCVEQLEALITDLLERWPQARMGPEAIVVARDMPFARPRPPRALRVRDDVVVSWFDTEYSPTTERAAHERAVHLEAPLPAGADRVTVGRLVRVRWADDITKPETVAAGLGRRQRWLATHFDGPIRRDFSEDGDLRHRPGPLLQHPQLSGHNPSHRRGYKKIPLRDGEFHAAWLAEVAAWTSRGQVDDRTPLDELWLLASDRATALRLAPLADAAGATGVLWIDKENDALWDPFPSGPWLEPEA